MTRFFKLFLTFFALAFSGLPLMAQSQGCIDYSSDDNLILRENGFSGPVTPVVRYTAIITMRDIHNSRGTRLTDFRSVMQQDRANVHKSGIPDSFLFEHDDGSGSVRISENLDGFFTSLNNRTILSQAKYYHFCSDTNYAATLEREILNAQVSAPLLSVTLFYHPSGGYGVLLSPTG